jgi:hypothetical protein
MIVGVLHVAHVALQSAGMKAFLSGALGGAVVDYHAFLQFHCWNDFKNYAWSTASFRWLQGGIATAVGASALGALLK